MPKIENPTSVTLYIQWILHPYKKPHVPEHRSENSKWALAQTKELLGTNSIKADDVKLAVQSNSNIRLEIVEPLKRVDDGGELWNKILTILKKSNDIETISIDVINDTSEMIAINLADQVSLPWHQVYQGHDTTTLIYHK